MKSPVSSSFSEGSSEIRFAVVMYGGVSLAIYINGVAQELLHMVRSTVTTEDGDTPLFTCMQLSPSERVYRKLSYLLAGKPLNELEGCLKGNAPITRKFIIDIISGTSAGGINGIFLAKALANSQSITNLEKLWVTEGDLSQLINDSKSQERPLTQQKPPQSLLNSQRMYRKLFEAFEDMDKSDSGGSSTGLNEANSFVDELDLFVTATDLQGITLPMQLSDRVVYERRHKNVFHFSRSSDDVTGGVGSRNDFVRKNNPFLAFAARCTSSFPFAFEPMRLTDINDTLNKLGVTHTDPSEWHHFFYDYANAVATSVPYEKRAFGDGGYLDNKPFTYAIETLSRRSGDVPVDRKLLYIEPSPEHPEDERESEGKPNAFQNSVAALMVLPRYETIRQDLERIFDRNRLIGRVDRIIRNVQNAVDQAKWKPAYDETDELWSKSHLTDEEWSTLDLAEMIKRKGTSYVAYHTLEIAAVTDELAAIVARLAGFDDTSDYLFITRGIVRAWRAQNYIEYKEGAESVKPTLNNFLHSFDYLYPIRRLNFLQKQIDQLYKLDKKSFLSEIGLIINLLTVKGYKNIYGCDEHTLEEESFGVDFKTELLNIKKEINSQYLSLRKTSLQLRSIKYQAREAHSGESIVTENPLYGKIGQLIADIRKLPDVSLLEKRDGEESFDPVVEYFMGAKRASEHYLDDFTVMESKIELRAKNIIGVDGKSDIATKLQEIGADFSGRISKAIDEVDRNIRTLINGKAIAAQESAGARVAKAVIRYYYDYYDSYDMIVFPILYGTNIGELDNIEVIRVSPEDADHLIDERQSGCHKLAGTKLGAFGAFLEKIWRQNDILWGRLDGTERIVASLFPAGGDDARTLLGEAQAAIVLETIEKFSVDNEVNDLLIESLMRTKSGREDRDGLTAFVEKLKSGATVEQRAQLDRKIDNGKIRERYFSEFEKRSKPQRQQAIENVARSTTVVGEMLTDMANQYKVSNKVACWLTRIGRISWGLLEVSVPQSMSNLFFNYWVQLLYLSELLLIVGGFGISVFNKVGEQITSTGLSLFVMTVIANVVVLVLGDYVQFKDKSLLQRLKWYKNLALGALVLCLAFGIFAILAVTGIVGSWWTTLGVMQLLFQQNSDNALKLLTLTAVVFIVWHLFFPRIKEFLARLFS